MGIVSMDVVYGPCCCVLTSNSIYVKFIQSPLYRIYKTFDTGYSMTYVNLYNFHCIKDIQFIGVAYSIYLTMKPTKGFAMFLK